MTCVQIALRIFIVDEYRYNITDYIPSLQTIGITRLQTRFYSILAQYFSVLLPAQYSHTSLPQQSDPPVRPLSIQLESPVQSLAQNLESPT